MELLARASENGHFELAARGHKLRHFSKLVTFWPIVSPEQATDTRGTPLNDGLISGEQLQSPLLRLPSSASASHVGRHYVLTVPVVSAANLGMTSPYFSFAPFGTLLSALLAGALGGIGVVAWAYAFAWGALISSRRALGPLTPWQLSINVRERVWRTLITIFLCIGGLYAFLALVGAHPEQLAARIN